MRTRAITCLIVILFSSGIRAQVKEYSLNDLAWTFHSADDNMKYPASVPGNIHTDLIKNKLIADPFYGNNEKSMSSIEAKKWIYEAELNISKEHLGFEKTDIIFEGLDTYADVYLNNQLIITANNMFRTWQASVKDKLLVGKNSIRVEFTPVEEGIENRSASELPYKLPGEPYVFVRKSPYHFGWDWGPKMLTVGIWKGVKLKIWNKNKIEHFSILQDKLSEKEAKISVAVKLKNGLSGNESVRVNLSGHKTKIEKYQKPSDTSKFIHFIIKDPALWWCNGMGDPNLYDIRIELLENDKTIDSRKSEFGIRSIELVQEPDEAGSSFYFRLNGKPVFVKGANMIPPRFFLPDVSTRDYQYLTDAAIDANMNMLRIWGGGSYEQDSFYSICNRKGIMVWQDFMFACAMYPGDDEFMENVEEEIEEQVIRLRNNPCIALWCGNNEIQEGWNNWGWQKQYNYSELDSLIIYTNYKRVFHKLIPDILARLDQSRPYHPSSPANGWGRKESLLTGDIHYWGVWWGKEPFDKYKEKVGRFVSEYGFQSLPDKESLKKFIPADEFYLGSVSMKNHQKHPTGFETIEEYMARDYKSPVKTEQYSYVSQLLQAKGMQMAIEAHRRAMPYCMGSLYWQLNDCWPAISWSSIDYYGNRKASYYAIKKAFAPFLISVDQQHDSLSVFLLNEKKEKTEGIMITEIIQFDGTVKYRDTTKVEVQSSRPLRALVVDSEKLTGLKTDSSQQLIKFSWYEPEKKTGKNIMLASRIHYLQKPAALNLKDPGLKIEKLNNGSTIILKAERYLAKDVRLFAGHNIIFSDNYFDLLPGQSKIIEISNRTSTPIPTYIEFTTLYDTIK